LSTQWVWEEYLRASIQQQEQWTVLEDQDRQLEQAARQIGQLKRELAETRAQLDALHRRQFKGRTIPAASPPAGPTTEPKRRGAPPGHPPWQRPKPKQIDRVVAVPAPARCPHCPHAGLQPVEELHEHVQEEIVLQPRTIATRYVHQQAYCAHCHRNVLQPGPGELLGSYIGPAAKATAIYMRYELNVPCRKISRWFADFFGLQFVPASAYGFERQAVRRGGPLYEDLRQKIRALPVAHADETSWRHDGQNHWVWYAGDDQLTFFQFDAHRSTQTAQSILGENFGGTLVADALASYQGVHPKDWQSCLAHIKTKAKQLDQELALLPAKAADLPARRFCQKVQGLVRDACRAPHRLARGPWRAPAARNTERRLRRQLRALCRTPLRYARAEAFRQRLLGPEQDHLFTCFRRPNVPPTNNQGERSLRPVVIMRKVIQCTRSPKGLHNHSVLRSLFETARRQGRKAHQFFRDLLTQDTAQAQAALYRKPLVGKPRPPPRG
jgi:hypothetical protein